MPSAITPRRGTVDLNTWLSAEVAGVDARLHNMGPTRQPDRQGVSPPGLNETEGRYFVLRRAARLLEQGQPLDPLRAEADKARAFLAAGAGLARNRVWAAYFAGVLKAVGDVSRQAGAERGGQPR